MKRKIILYPFLFGIFPVFSLFLANIYKVPASDIIAPLIYVLFFTAFLILFFRVLFRDDEKTALFVSLFNVLFFSFGHIQLLLRQLPPLGVLCGLITSLCLIAFCIRKAKNIHSVSKVIKAMGIFLVSFSLLNIVVIKTTSQRYIKQNNFEKKKLSQGAKKMPVNERPNIYYIIVDGYARQDVLKRIYDYDNSGFINFLKDKGFYVADKSFANYCQTVLSIPSTLNTRYLNDVEEHFEIQPGNPMPLYFLWRKNSIFNFFRKLGYKIITFDAQGWNVYLREQDVDVLYKTPNIGLMTNFQSQLLDTTPLSYVLVRIFNRQDIRYSFLRKRILNAFKKLKEMPSEKGPCFVFGHILSPHQPLLFDEKGEFILPKIGYYTEWFPMTEGRDRDQYIKKYRGQVAFVNNKIREIINNILSNSSTVPIIILQSDHGPCANLDPEDAKKTDQTERMGILNAYYFPDRDYSRLYKNITPVNSFRVILNQFFGENLEMLDERSYFTSWSKTYDFVDVTKDIDKE